MKEPRKLRVLIAPDWRSGSPYQRLLTEALAAQKIEIDFLSEYRRLLPLARAVPSHSCDLLHLHWPEAYYLVKGSKSDIFRRARFKMDLRLATRSLPMVLTAHNLVPHNRGSEAFVRANAVAAFKTATRIIAHSTMAKDAVVKAMKIDSHRCHVVRHGDLSIGLGGPLPRQEARGRLSLGSDQICLMFGTVEPYKGVEEIISFWKREVPSVTLAIVGKPMTNTYGEAIGAMASDTFQVITRFGWLSDEALKLWLSAVDVVLFNYTSILTSGAACLARSWGVPILIREDLTTVDLDEPSPLVFRFDTDLAAQLKNALSTVPDYSAASDWRAACDWRLVAQSTIDVYREAVADARANKR